MLLPCVEMGCWCRKKLYLDTGLGYIFSSYSEYELQPQIFLGQAPSEIQLLYCNLKPLYSTLQTHLVGETF